jgi:predicted porin
VALLIAISKFCMPTFGDYSMKKSLLAFAVLSAFAGAASAQTNVTIYGVVDIGLAREDNGVNTSTRMDSGNQSGSRLGFKGTEDLGGGLSAVFAIENGFSADTGTLGQGGRIFGRQAWVGLNGGFGSVKLGRQYTPIFGALDTIDPFGTGLTGGGSGITSLFNGHGVRMDNTINYSISANGFSGQAAYGFGEVAGNTSASRQYGLSLGYANGPITVVLAHHNTNGAAPAVLNAKTTLLGGTYNFGPVTLHGAYALNKGDAGLDTRDAMLGVSAPVGAAGTVMVDYLRKNDKNFNNSNAAQVAVGYTHSLSKRTNLYTSYSRNTNDSAVAYNAAGNGLTDTLFNVGIRHKF